MSTHARDAEVRPWLVLAVLCMSLFVIVADTTIVNVALPTLVRKLHASDTQLEWIVDAYNLVFAALLLAAGSLSDRFGRRGALAAGLTIFGLGSLTAAVVSSPSELIAARSVMGAGAALIFPATLGIISNVFRDPGERARAIGIWTAVSGARRRPRPADRRPVAGPLPLGVGVPDQRPCGRRRADRWAAVGADLTGSRRSAARRPRAGALDRRRGCPRLHAYRGSRPRLAGARDRRRLRGALPS